MTVRIWCLSTLIRHASIILDIVDIAVVTIDITDVTGTIDRPCDSLHDSCIRMFGIACSIDCTVVS